MCLKEHQQSIANVTDELGQIAAAETRTGHIASMCVYHLGKAHVCSSICV